MYNYLSSYIYGGAPEETAPKQEAADNKPAADEQMNQYNSGKEELQQEKALAPSNASGGGILNSIYTKMSGHPTCEVVLQKFEGRNHFTAGDDLHGRIIIKTSVDGQHINH